MAIAPHVGVENLHSRVLSPATGGKPKAMVEGMLAANSVAAMGTSDPKRSIQVARFPKGD
jgi:hypothetical protein